MAASSELVTPYNTTEFNALCNQARKLFHGLHDQLFVISAELRPALREAHAGRSGLLGTDSRIAAQQVARQFTHAGVLQLDAATAMANAWVKYQTMFVGPTAGAGRRTFRVDK